jgi:hypothetical protein
MELPDTFTSFWFASVRSGSFTKVVVPIDTQCFLTNACICQDFGEVEPGSRTLYLRVNQMAEIAIVPFLMNKFESTNLDLRFGEGDILRFRTSGLEYRVQVCGYLMGGFEIEKSEEPF